MAENGNRKQNKKSGSINVGKLIFGAVLIYLVAMTALYFTKDRITSYEVKIGKLSRSISATGVVLREENVYYAPEDGNITFYASEADKVRVGSNLYSIDKSGGSAVSAADYNGDNSLEDDDYEKLENEVNEFQGSYDPVYFDRTYDFAYRLESGLLDIYNRNLLKKMQGEITALNITTASDDGIIAYTIDGYETLTRDEISQDVFEKKEYHKQDIRENSDIRTGDPIYKLVTGEKWSIIVPIKAEDFAVLAEKDRRELEVRIEKDNTLLWADASFFEQNGEYYIDLTFYNSMLRYLSDRYLEVTVILAEEKGLKIPNTAITEKPFYLIPSEYVSSTNGSAAAVYVKNDDVVTKKSVTIYNEDEEARQCYIDCSALEAGTQLIKSDSLETYTVSAIGTLKGVYSINKGYAVFKQIREIYASEEYAIIEEGTSYGISNYDFIALDSSVVKEDDIVY